VYYPRDEKVPVDHVVADAWREPLYQTDSRGRERIVRSVYEVCVFAALRDRLRCKEIWVVGAEKWRNPEQDLPADFEQHRAEHYASLSKPLDPAAFVAELQDEMRHELGLLNDQLPDLAWVDIAERKSGPIRLTPLDAVAEPTNLRRLKAEVARRWGVVHLLDVLKEADLRIGFTSEFTPVATREAIDRDTLQQRLLLAIYAYGTNTGLRRIAQGEHGHSDDDLRYVRSRYMNLDAGRRAAARVANATFAARQVAIWGRATTAVASDSTHFVAYDQNIFTEWHARYGGRGVLIYWHVERNSMAVYSQLINCSASEVAAMVEGAIRHGTDMDVEANYTDSHGASEIGFGITRLLGFELLPRLKRINVAKLYRPAAGQPDAYPSLAPAMSRPIRWDLIAQQYDQMIKYATAIRVGTASTEAILRRFTRANNTHPTYQAMLEVGRAQKTIFVARYLRLRELQREINDGLNVMESWNGANAIIHYGRSGEFASNRRDEQELGAIALHILQAALVYVNTLMIQDVLAEPAWSDVLTDDDLRGLTPLFWTHITPYGVFRLQMDQRLALTTPPAPDTQEDQPLDGTT
jgi:TnpA family transposase